MWSVWSVWRVCEGVRGTPGLSTYVLRVLGPEQTEQHDVGKRKEEVEVRIALVLLHEECRSANGRKS